MGTGTDRLKLEIIRIDGGTQSRAAIDEAVVAEYAEHLADLPPADVYFDGADNWLADGFHRYHAHRKAEAKTMPCLIHKGTCRDAILHSLKANVGHGLRRSNADKRKSVDILLHDEEWSKKSDRWIAEAACVSDHLVADVRRQLEFLPVGQLRIRAVEPASRAKNGDSAPRAVKSKDGKTRNVAKIAATTKARAVVITPPPEPKPEEKIVIDTLVPWGQFNADVGGVLSDLRSIGLRLGKVLEWNPDAKKLQSKWAHFLSHAGTVGAVNAVVRNIKDNLPASADGKPPGFLPARVVEAREAVKAGK